MCRRRAKSARCACNRSINSPPLPARFVQHRQRYFARRYDKLQMTCLPVGPRPIWQIDKVLRRTSAAAAARCQEKQATAESSPKCRTS
jgi:hypothetical protein